MIAELDRHREDVAELCRRFDVSSLFVFGSAVSDGFDPGRSDIDFLVEFVHPASVSRFDAFFGLKDGLEDLFGRRVDLVSESALENPYLAETITRTRRELYAA